MSFDVLLGACFHHNDIPKQIKEKQSRMCRLLSAINYSRLYDLNYATANSADTIRYSWTQGTRHIILFFFRKGEKKILILAYCIIQYIIPQMWGRVEWSAKLRIKAQSEKPKGRPFLRNKILRIVAYFS